YIPLASSLDAPNYGFPSPKAAEFGLECGTWLETIMTELLNDPRVDSVSGIEKLRKRPGFKAYMKAFTERFGLEKGGWRLKDSEADEIWPFESWKQDENPEWYRIYSRYKHDRIALASKWTMKQTVQIFTALTIVIQHWPKPESWTKRESRVLEGVIY
ncbi:MAG: hypothetical protein KAW09_08310, partial [Thermoplasmata archaeon]|nr:hypothetical protein [Thermoplasmata archaeon]